MKQYLSVILLVSLHGCVRNYSNLIRHNVSCIEHLKLNNNRDRKALNNKIDSVLKAINYTQGEYEACQSNDSTTFIKFIQRNKSGEKSGAIHLIIESPTKVRFDGESFIIY